MSTDFASVAAGLEAYLKPLVPQKWRVQDAGRPLSKTAGVVLTYSQGNVVTEVPGSALPPGTVGVEFALILSTPETDPTKGWPRLNGEAPHLFAALDGNSQLLWTGAERAVLETGESIYNIPITVLTTYNTEGA